MIATINAILWTGAKPVIVDVDESLCLSLEKLSQVKKLHTVIFVPLNGRAGQGKDIDTMVASAKSYVNALNKLINKRDKFLSTNLKRGNETFDKHAI